MNYLLDTCVISEVIKPRPSRRVISWLKKQDENSLYISVLTLGEIHKGIEKIGDAARKKKLHLWVENNLLDRFSGRILQIDSRVATVWGQVQGKAELEGQAMPAIDGLIAATGLAYDMVVVTRNTSDMRASKVALFNPWHKQ